MTDTSFGSVGNSELAETIWALIVERGNPAQVLELLYWSEEPGFFDLIRTLAATPVGAREGLQRFLQAAPSIELVRAAAEGRDRLVLSLAEEKSVAGLRRTAKVASNA
jgi:hypothetical protein